MMKKTALYLFFLLSFLTTCSKPTTIFDENKDYHPEYGMILSVNGEAKILNNELNEKQAEFSDLIQEDDRLITQNGNVDVQFFEKLILKLSTNTVVKIKKIETLNEQDVHIEIVLLQGKIYGVSLDNKKGIKIISSSTVIIPNYSKFIFESDLKKYYNRLKVNEGDVFFAVNTTQEAFFDSTISSVRIPQKTSIVSKIGQNSKNIPYRLDQCEEQGLEILMLVKGEKLKEFTRVKSKFDNEKLTETELNKLKSELALKEGYFLNIYNKLPKTCVTKRIHYRDEYKEIRSDSKKIEYIRMEKVILNNGTEIIGAIIDQKGNTIIIHTEKGIKKINKKEVKEVDYDFKTRVKL